LAIKLKEEMGIENILKREHEILNLVFPRLKKIPGLHILADQHEHRLGVISFYIDGLHYNLAVKLLNDRYGIQVRGGCSCAGTYGHYLLEVSYEKSKSITDNITHGILMDKPGWVRMSFHPTTTNEEIEIILDALEELAANHFQWASDYKYCTKTNEFQHIDEDPQHLREQIVHWFDLDPSLTPEAFISL